MLPADFYDITREGLVLALLLSAPLLAAALLAGLVSALLGSFAKISEPALTYVPRFLAVALTALVVGPEIAIRVAAFTERVLSLVEAVNL